MLQETCIEVVKCFGLMLSPNFGLGAAPKVNKAPKTPTLTLRRTTSLQHQGHELPNCGGKQYLGVTCLRFSAVIGTAAARLGL